jgi:hypothetical protein
MKIDIALFLYWVIVPFLNFLFWFHLSRGHFSSQARCKKQVTALEQAETLKVMLEQSLIELQAETSSRPCEEALFNELPQCHHYMGTSRDDFFMTLEDTIPFEKYRRERLASMTLDLVIQTYTNQDTVVLHYRGALSQRNDESTDNCQSLDHHFLDYSDNVCMAIMISSNTDNTLDVARIDQDIDIYGLSVSNPDPSQIDKYSSKFILNSYNKNKFWPTGFFRKVPKERGRIRTKEKLGTFLLHFNAMQNQLLAKLSTHDIKKGDDLVVMVLNEGELDLYLNFACSCRLHEISLHNVIVFAGSRYGII